MKLSDYLAEFISKQGIDHVFQIIGGASVHMVNSIAQRKDLSYICVQHEQAGAMAAEAYSRITKNFGAAMATSGPGMTNLVTGIACAYFDSIPVIYITGNVNTFESKQDRQVRQVGFQETDIIAMVKSITKFAVRVEDPEKIRYFLEKAVAVARSGRPGPVLLDMPMNVQRAEIDPKKLETFDKKELKVDIDTIKDIKTKIGQAIALVATAKRPIVIAGGGVRYADQTELFRKVIDKLGFPVVATWSGIDVLTHDHPLYIGQIGVYGNRGANFTVQNSDLIISIGSRLDTRITGGQPETFARAAKKIVIDIDRAELYKNRGLTPDIGICADVKDFLPQFLTEIRKARQPKVNEWIQKTKEWKLKYPKVLPEWRKRKDKVDPYVFIENLFREMSPDSTTVTDCGGNLTWTIQACHIRGRQRLFSAMGNSPMGYSLSAAIGASIALKKKPVVCIIGDGGFQLNIQELQTLKYYNLPLKVFILNNHSYGIIKQFQEMYFSGRYEGTTAQSGYTVPDFISVAKAYGLTVETIRNHRELALKIRKVLNHKGPVICDVTVPEGAKLIPKVAFPRPIEDMSPELSRKEFLSNMLISPLPVSLK